MGRAVVTRASTPRLWARLGMMGTTVPRWIDDPVGHADAMTSMNDWRTALCIAHGVPLEQIAPASGHNLSGRSLNNPRPIQASLDFGAVS